MADSSCYHDLGRRRLAIRLPVSHLELTSVHLLFLLVAVLRALLPVLLLSKFGIGLERCVLGVVHVCTMGWISIYLYSPLSLLLDRSLLLVFV